MDRFRGLIGLLVVAILTGIAFAPCLGNGFAYDDAVAVRSTFESGGKNRMIHELQPIAEYFRREYWTGTGGSELDSNPLYRPVTVLSYALVHAIWPGDGSLPSEARPHHVVNWLLQIVNTVLVFFLVRHFTGRGSWGPVAAAAVFGLAGIRAEAVAANVGRADLLAFTFGAGALGLVAMLMADDRGPWRRAAAGAGFLVLSFLSYCCKESALAWWPLSVCAGLALHWQHGAQLRRVVLPAAIGGAAALLWIYLRAQAFADLPEPEPVALVANPLRDLPVGHRVFAALAIWGYSLSRMVVPWNLVSDYGSVVFPFAEPDGGGTVLAGLYLVPLVATGVVGWWAVARPVKRPLLFLAVAAFLGFGFITSNVAVVIGTIWGERLAYLPSVGFALAAGWWFTGRVRPAAAGLLGAYLLCNAAIAFDRVRDWKDDATLFLTDVDRQPRSLVLRLQAAVQEEQRGNPLGWRSHLETAIEIEPEWARAYIELGAGGIAHALSSAPSDPQALAAYMKPHLEAAEDLLRRGMRARIVEAKEQPMLWRNLAVVLVKSGRVDEAYALFEKVTALRPEHVLSRHRILVDGAGAFRDDQFTAILAAGERLQPDLAIWRMHRGLHAARRGDATVGRRHLEAALPKVHFFDIHVQRAWLTLAELRLATGDAAGAKELCGKIVGSARFDPSIRAAADRLRR